MTTNTAIVAHSLLPWKRSLDTVMGLPYIEDANGEPIIMVSDEQDLEYTLHAVNSHAQLVAALYNLWLQVLIHHPRDTRLTIYADEAADALNHAGIDLLTGEALALAAGGEG